MNNLSGAYVRRQEMVCTEADLTTYGDKVLLDGEVIYVRMNDGSVKQKMGNGTTPVSDLPFTDFGVEKVNTAAQEALTEIADAKAKMLGEIELAAEIVQTIGDSETAAMSQKAVKNFLNFYENIDRTGRVIKYSDGYYHLSTGNFVLSDNYKSTIYFPVFMYDYFDKGYRDVSYRSYLSLKKNGVYVGYLMGDYIDANGETVENIDFDEFALCFNTDIEYDTNYDKAWFDNFITNGLYNEKISQIYTGEFVWLNGYYHFTKCGAFVEADTYKCTAYMHAKLLDYVANLSVLATDTNSGLVFKKDGVYAGYKVGTVYYLPNGSVVDDVDFDEFAIVVNTNFSDYTIYKLLSLSDIESQSVLYGKKLGVIGDSIAHGAGYAGGYAGIIGAMFNMTVENRAVNGATLVPSSGLPQILPQLNNLSDDCDYIILEGGYNDSWANGGSPIGEYSADFGEPIADGTFYGNLNYLLYNALVKFHGKKMCFVIVHQSRPSYSVASDSEYYLATVKLCNKWGVPIVDLNKNCPPLGMVATTNPLYTDYTNLSGHPDGVHPSENGYRKYYVPQIVRCLEAL